jgi:hypothetical protein
VVQLVWGTNLLDLVAGKSLPVAYREGQVEYLGKGGISLLGAILVRRVERDCKVMALDTYSLL